MDGSRERIIQAKVSWRAYRAELRKEAEVADMRIGIASTITADPLVPFLGSALLARGIRPDVRVAPYGQVFQACLDWKSAFAQGTAPGDANPSSLDAIVILWRFEELLGDELAALSSNEGIPWERAFEKIDDLVVALNTLAESFDGSILVNSPPYPQSPPVDIEDLAYGAPLRLLYLAVASRWQEYCSNNERLLCYDLDQLQRSAGASRIEDLRKWYLYRQPFAEWFWLEIGSLLARILSIGRVPPRKCVAIDCDNTLWGGIVGEDGIEGIQLGNDFPGSSFRDFQRQLLSLHNRGVLLALATKNDEEAVWEVFDRHDAMVLKREHLAAWRINWDAKSENLSAIAKELNFGLDSFVFIDDNPVEIEEVSSRLPEVHCLKVPEELAELPGLLRGNDLFDSIHVTEEDRQRTKMVRSEIERVESRKAMTQAEFLRSLEIQIRVEEASPEQLGRVAQLVNKTNQFNLTTIRRSQDELHALSRSDDHKLYSLFVSDRFGDYGLVGVAIVRLDASEWTIDTFLMSCRVLGRGVESAFLAAVAQDAESRSVQVLVGAYLPTPKNAVVSSFLGDHGFETRSDDDRRWTARVTDIPGPPAHIAMKTSTLPA